MKDEIPKKRVVAVFTITVEVHEPEATPTAETLEETTQQTLDAFKEKEQEVEPDLKRVHEWRAFKRYLGPERRARYPERKTHTCSQCGALNRHNNPAKGGCVECRATHIYTDQGGRIE